MLGVFNVFKVRFIKHIAGLNFFPISEFSLYVSLCLSLPLSHTLSVFLSVYLSLSLSLLFPSFCFSSSLFSTFKTGFLLSFHYKSSLISLSLTFPPNIPIIMFTIIVIIFKMHINITIINNINIISSPSLMSSLMSVSFS